MSERHVHACPECCRNVPCELDCTMESDRRLADGTLKGASAVCAACDEEERLRVHTSQPARVTYNGDACYVDDSRTSPVHELAIFVDDQGDIYVMVRPVGHKMGPSVRLCASGGADSKAPGLRKAMLDARAAIVAAAGGAR